MLMDVSFCLTIEYQQKKRLLKASLSGVISRIHPPVVIGRDELIPSEAYSNRHITRGYNVVIFSGGKERQPAA